VIEPILRLGARTTQLVRLWRGGLEIAAAAHWAWAPVEAFGASAYLLLAARRPAQVRESIQESVALAPDVEEEAVPCSCGRLAKVHPLVLAS
jgi:hypothetical protein